MQNCPLASSYGSIIQSWFNASKAVGRLSGSMQRSSVSNAYAFGDSDYQASLCKYS